MKSDDESSYSSTSRMSDEDNNEDLINTRANNTQRKKVRTESPGIF
jgi:hypothetical protein